ncbi:MAG: hypothetical protein KF829_03765 [Ferruginibacter sp.]|nr:hypothetical protein [Ferruginibacter sp.]
MKNISIFCLVCFCVSCSSPKNEKNSIYQQGRRWDYKVIFYNSDKTIKDTCSLSMEVKKGNFISFLSGQKNLTYSYRHCCNKNMTESTGVEEDSTHVFIHPPRLDCFAFTEMTPMPAISLPIVIGSTKELTLKIVKSTFSELSGKTISQYQKVVGKENFKYKNTNLSTYAIEGENTSFVNEFGKYFSTFLFNEALGFVFLKYQNPNGEFVTMTLEDTNFDNPK